MILIRSQAGSDRAVVAVVGDGGFQMTVGELAAARRLGLRVPVVVLNDGWLGLMKVKQERLSLAYSASALGEQVEPPAHYFGVPVRAARTLDEGREAVRPTSSCCSSARSISPPHSAGGD